MNTNLILFNRPPMILIPEMADMLGFNDAVILQQLHYWLQIKKKKKDAASFIDGHYWVYNTIAEWKEQFIYLSECTIKRVFNRLKKKGIVCVKQYNKHKYNNTNFYTINYKVLNECMLDYAKKELNSDENDTDNYPKDESEMIQGWERNDPGLGAKSSRHDGSEMIPSYKQRLHRDYPETTPKTTNGISEEIPCSSSQGKSKGKAKPALGEKDEGFALENLDKKTPPDCSFMEQPVCSSVEQLSMSYFGSFYPEARDFFDSMSTVSDSQLRRTIEKVVQHYPVDIACAVIKSFNQKSTEGAVQCYNPTYFFDALEEEVEMQRIHTKFKQFCIDYFGAGETALEVHDFYKNILKSKQDKATARLSAGVSLHERRIKNVESLVEQYGLSFFLKVIRAYREGYENGSLMYDPTITRFTNYLKGFYKNTSEKSVTKSSEKEDEVQNKQIENIVITTPYERITDVHRFDLEYYNWSFQCTCGNICDADDSVCSGCGSEIDYYESRKKFNSLLRKCACGSVLFEKEKICFVCGAEFDLQKSVDRLTLTIKNSEGKKDGHGANVQICQDEGHRSTQSDS